MNQTYKIYGVEINLYLRSYIWQSFEAKYDWDTFSIFLGDRGLDATYIVICLQELDFGKIISTKKNLAVLGQGQVLLF